jgi:hypothetical protein
MPDERREVNRTSRFILCHSRARRRREPGIHTPQQQWPRLRELQFDRCVWIPVRSLLLASRNDSG